MYTQSKGSFKWFKSLGKCRNVLKLQSNLCSDFDYIFILLGNNNLGLVTVQFKDSRPLIWAQSSHMS